MKKQKAIVIPYQNEQEHNNVTKHTSAKKLKMK